MSKKQTNLPNLLILGAVLTLAFVATGCGLTEESNKETSQNNISNNLEETAKTEVKVEEKLTIEKKENTEKTKESNYKNGKYDVKGTYISPAGPEEIKVSVTLVDGVVTETTVVPEATHPVSQKLQTAFSESYKTEVVGKKISDIKLSKVAGASLTTEGFNKALTEIKEQASL